MEIKNAKLEISEEFLATISANLDTLAKKYNENLNAEHPSLEVQMKLDGEFKEAEANYLFVKARLVWRDCALSDAPMRTAIIKHSFSVKRHKLITEGEKDAAHKVCKIVEVDRPIDLLAFDEYYATKNDGKSASVNPKWAHMVTKLTMLLTADVAKSLGINPKTINDSYAMSEIARAIDLGKTPTSNTKMLETVQSILDAIIYEENEKTHKNSYRVSSHDIAYLREIFSKKGKAELSVACSKPSMMRMIMADIAYRIVGDKLYSVEYKMKKMDKDEDKSGDCKTVNPANDKKQSAKTAPTKKEIARPTAEAAE